MSLPRRFPLSPVAATIFAAAAITALLAIFANARVTEVRRGETARAQARLSEAALRAEDVLSGMTQLLRVQIAVIAPSRRRSDVIDGVRRLKATANRRLVYGIALAYAPYRFDASTRDFGVYSRATDASTDLVMLVDGFDSVDYEAADWFERGRSSHGGRAFVLPYQGRDDEVYVAAVQPFYSGRRFDGVALVNVKLATFRDLLVQSLAPTDRIEIVDAKGRALWRTGAAPAAGEASAEAPLRAVPWSVRLTSAMPGVRRAAAISWSVACVIALFVWFSAAFVVRYQLFRRAARAEADARLGSVALQREIASRVAAEDRLRIAADQDSLTGLPNRRHAVNVIAARIDAAKHGPGRSFAVFFIDLDRFALINDSLGHSVGDVVLTMIAQRIAEALPDDALLARFGGDEFVVVSNVDRGRKSPANVAARLVEAIREPLPLRDREINLTGSIGVVTGLGTYDDAEAMLRDADIAMYAAKDSGRARHVLFDKRLRE
ncbi:MAG TPA: diguanylate cyclase, partial [Candidatus Acidoferrales bacterium]|nr:diguanylate cyclase [Candidatus Acidoferrales bacterium]